MDKLKVLKRMLVLAVTVAMLSACANKAEENKNQTSGGESAKTEQVNTPGKTEKKVEFDAFPAKLTAEKIGDMEVSGSITATPTGVIYTSKDKKYGIISSDGENDTGAIYEYCEKKGDYFAVIDTVAEPGDVTAMNVMALVDGNGNEIIPAEYAFIEVLSDRYVKTCKATEETDSEDDALLFGTNSIFALYYPDEGDKLYKGNWCIYDLVTGNKIEGVTGTKAYSITTNGEFITYVTDDEKRITVNCKGEEISYARTFADSSYCEEDNSGEGRLFSADGEELYSYKKDDFKPNTIDEESGLYVAVKYGDTTKYAVMDKNGKVVSEEFDKTPAIHGDYLLVDGMVCDFEGNQVVQAEVQSVYADTFTGKAYMLKTTDDRVIVIDDNKNVIYESENSGDYYADSTNFTVSKKSNGKAKYYSLKDEDYTIEGSVLAPWVVRTGMDDNNEAKLIDTISGETILEGYKTYQAVDNDGNVYVYAKVDEGKYDIYLIK